MSRKFITICIALVLASTTYAGVIGNWEDNSGDGWKNWSPSALIGPLPNTISGTTITYSQATIGATLGSSSLEVSGITSNVQSLTADLTYAQRVDFMANNKFSIDYTVAAGTTGGWNEIYMIYLNAEGYGWHGIGTAPIKHYDFWSGSAQRTTTVSFDYTAAKASMPAVPGYVQIVFSLNSGTGTNSHEFYFDNARLTPEPATIAMLGLGGLALIRRKR
jgi:hypothetical protein